MSRYISKTQFIIPEYRFNIGDTVAIKETLGEDRRVFITGHSDGMYDVGKKLSRENTFWRVAERNVSLTRKVLVEKSCGLKICFR